MKKLTYYFNMNRGPNYYSEEENDYIKYDYFISQNEILNGLIEYLEIKNKSLKSQVIEIIKKLEVEIDESEIINNLNNYNNIYLIINNLLNNIENFLNEDMNNYLKDYYYEEAYNNFLKNN